MKEKMTVHNLMEVKALIKESFVVGDENEFDGTRWFTHANQFLCLSSVDLTEFTLHLDTRDSVTVDVLWK